MKVVNAACVLQVKPPVHSRLAEREKEREDNDKERQCSKIIKTILLNFHTQKKQLKYLP